VQPAPVYVQPAPVVVEQPQQPQQVFVRPGQRVVVQQGGNTTIVVQGAPANAPTRPYIAPPPPGSAPAGYVIVNNQNPDFYRQREWGFNISIQGALIGGGRSSSSSSYNSTYDNNNGYSGSSSYRSSSSGGMGGLGLALRYRATPYVAAEGMLGFYGGTDAAGQSRAEVAMQLNGMFFFTPRSRFQPYVLGGIGFGSASVNTPGSSSSDAYASYRGNGSYRYFGVQAGIGAEYRFGPHFAVNSDLRGFIRGRTDRNGGYEFISNSGQATNTSGGGVFSVGATYYF
jgi:hypothetical protein